MIFESTNYNFTKGLLPCSYSPSASIFSVEIGPASETRTPRLARRTASRRAGERQLQALPLVIDQTHFQMSSPQRSSVRQFLIAYGPPHKSPVSSNSTRSSSSVFRPLGESLEIRACARDFRLRTDPKNGGKPTSSAFPVFSHSKLYSPAL
jgi:hypothetical protein